MRKMGQPNGVRRIEREGAYVCTQEASYNATASGLLSIVQYLV